MSNPSRDIELLRQNDHDLRVQYEELLRLRAKVGSLLYPSKQASPRKCRITRSNRLTTRTLQRMKWPAVRHPSCY